MQGFGHSERMDLQNKAGHQKTLLAMGAALWCQPEGQRPTVRCRTMPNFGPPERSVVPPG